MPVLLWHDGNLLGRATTIPDAHHAAAERSRSPGPRGLPSAEPGFRLITSILGGLERRMDGLAQDVSVCRRYLEEIHCTPRPRHIQNIMQRDNHGTDDPNDLHEPTRVD